MIENPGFPYKASIGNQAGFERSPKEELKDTKINIKLGPLKVGSIDAYGKMIRIAQNIRFNSGIRLYQKYV